MDLRKSIFFYADLASFPVNGAADVLYVDKDTGFIYSWNGSTYLAAGTGGLNYLGLWDANANSPAITSGVGSVGDYYIVGTAGTTNIDGISDWEVGDWIIFGGSAWQKIDNSEVNLNIYNSDGTLTGNRTASLGGHKLIFDNGSVGINANPSTALHVNALAIPAGEAVARFGTTDSSAYLQVSNGTGTNGVFAPLLQGKQVGTSLHSAIALEGIIDAADDTGAIPITVFQTRLATFLSVVTRPLFQFRNYGLNIMTMLADGNVGIGTTTPTAKLEVNGPAFPGIESVAKFTVSDDASSSLQIRNGTSAAATFLPEIQGTNSTNRPALGISGIATTDTGTEAVTIFQSLLASATAVVTRPIFQWKNFSTNVMTMLANGNVGIGTTTPGEKLEVSGKTKTTTFQMTTTPTAGYVLTSDASGNGSWSPASSGGLTNFTEAQSTAAPNATVPVDSLTAVSAATNADVAIVPKGAGALMLDIPNNSTTGGNKRGQYAIDLQHGTRASADKVASGDYSVVIGRDNRSFAPYAIGMGYGAFSGGNFSTAFQQASATGNFGFAHGQRATASGSAAVSFGGYGSGDSIASGDYSFTAGASTASGIFSIATGESNTASGQGAAAVGGRNNLANAYLSSVSGGYCTANAVEGRQVRGRALGTVQGETQKSEFFLSIRTTGNTATTVTVAGGAAGTSNQVILSNNSAFRFKGTIIGKQSGSTNVAAWDVDGIIVRGANAAATTLSLGNVTLVQNTPAWGTPTLAADTTNGGLRVQVTGAAATNIQWTAVIETTEVIYA